MVETQEAAVDAPAEPRRRAWPRRIEPLHVLLVLAGLAGLLIMTGPIADIDLYWHVLIGREVIDTGRIGGLGAGWSLNPTGTGWRTTQWLSEVVLSRTQDWFGWRGIIVLRGLLGLLLVLLLARQLLRRAVPRVAAPVFAVVVIPVAAIVQERPMLATLLLTVWLAGVATDLLLDGLRPSLPLTFGLVVLWANLHGGWVLAPLVLGAVALACAVQGGALLGRARTALLLTGLTLVAGCLTPLGLRGLIAPFQFRSSTRLIVEWAATQAWGPYGIAIGLLVGTLVWTWARADTRPEPAELLYVAFLTAFALQAFRNVAPALLLLAPLVVERVSRSYRPSEASVGRREALALWTLVGVMTVGAVGFLAASYATVDPLRDAKPLAIARTLAATPGEKRVFNAYNASGVLAAFGGPGVRLAIDGRADRYGDDVISRYADAQSLSGDWQAVLRQVRPDHAVLPTKAPLVAELQRQGWRLVQTDGAYVLLVKDPTEVPR